MTLYEMLVGTTPFGKSDTEYSILKKIVEEKFEPPDKINPSIPKKLSKIILKAIEKDPAKRYQNTSEMLTAIEQFESSQVSGAGKLPFRRQNYTRITLITLIGLFIALIVLLPILSSDVASGIKNLWNKFTKQTTTEETFLSINTSPDGAAVYLNDDLIGTTPIQDFQGKPGEANLRIAKQGYVVFDTLVVLKKSKLVTLNCPLVIRPNIITASEESELLISTTPSGATVWLNDIDYVGRTPLSNNIKRPPGRYKLSLKLPGYKDHIDSITVYLGRAFALENIRLFQSVGSLNISTTIQNVSIWLDGKLIRQGVTPWTFDNLTLGNHDISIRKKGYLDWNKTIQIESRKTTPLAVELEPIYCAVSVLVKPKGTIIIDEETVGNDTQIRQTKKLISGAHKIKAVNPYYGIWDKTISIFEKDTVLIVDFNKTVKLNISSNIHKCELWIDGKLLPQKEPPCQISFPIGMHKIELKKTGYKAKSLKIGDQVMNLNNGAYEFNFETDYIGGNALVFQLEEI